MQSEKHDSEYVYASVGSKEHFVALVVKPKVIGRPRNQQISNMVYCYIEGFFNRCANRLGDFMFLGRSQSRVPGTEPWYPPQNKKPKTRVAFLLVSQLGVFLLFLGFPTLGCAWHGARWRQPRPYYQYIRFTPIN